ncbi:phosphoglycerate mutase-like protein [Phlebopus sp. FC_14]|nr:phosphoglycerate mutase-like protein [Phlebopus sp. FC_14]
MIERIYIARHGYRLNWVDTNWKSATGLPRDPPLAAYGEAQAQELASYFRSLPEEKRPTAIFSSPYYRCLQTSLPTARALGLPICVEHGIAEWYSPVAPGTGLHPRPMPASDLRSYFAEIDPSWSSVWYPSRKGEDVEEVHARAFGFLKIFIPEIEGRCGIKHKNILLISHAATIIALCRGLLMQPNLPLRIGCCSISEFFRNSDVVGAREAWHVKILADGRHLRDGASRDWGFEDIEIANGKVINDTGMPGTEDSEEDISGPQIHRSVL